MKLYFVFLISLILLINYSNGECPDNTPKECRTPGPLCETCTGLVECIETADGLIKSIPIPCPSGQTCHINACTTNPNQICDPTLCAPFPCGSIGVFPHPSKCKEYVFCVPQADNVLLAIPVTCEEGYGYNALTKVCDVPLVNNTCPQDVYPIPSCSLSTAGPVIGNPSLYYICQPYANQTEPYPYQYQCDHGGVYKNYQCK